MRVLFDVVHPADVHFYRHLASELSSTGHRILFAGRNREFIPDLLKHYALPHELRGGPRRSRPAQLGELIDRVRWLRELARAFLPDVILTRNPSGAIAGRLTGVQSVFDTDDGWAAGIHTRIGVATASVVTAPVSLEDDLGRKLQRYPALKCHAFLHPTRFQAPPRDTTAPYAVVRLVALNAVHDHGKTRLPTELVDALIQKISSRMDLRVSVEPGAEIPSGSIDISSIAPSDMPTILAKASLFVGDSQSMAAEAAILGVPAVHISPWSGKLGYLNTLAKGGLLTSTTPDTPGPALARIDEVLADLDAANLAQRERAAIFNQTCIDVTRWYRSLLEGLVGS